jgi:transcriptional regulator with XRE-family HTH domain
MTPLAKLVRTRRLALGLSPEQLGARLHVSRFMVEKVELAYCMVKLDSALRWCRVLGVTPDAFVRAAARSVRIR